MIIQAAATAKKSRARPGQCPLPADTRPVTVPPVGVEPTLGTLLGGRPLPLGYGGWVMIPRPPLIIRGRPLGWRKLPLSCIYSILRSCANAERNHIALTRLWCVQRVIIRGRPNRLTPGGRRSLSPQICPLPAAPA